MEESAGPLQQQQSESAKGGGSDLGGMVTPLLAVVGGSIGVLSFVAFFGAAILWVRMDQAHIPANEAVAVVPKSVLITTGATFLVPALLAALGFSLFLFLIEVAAEQHARRQSALQELEGALALEVEVEAQEKAALNTAIDAVERAGKLESLAGKAGEADSIDPDTVGKIEQTAKRELESVDRLAEKAVPGEELKSKVLKARKDVNKEQAVVRNKVEKHQYKRRTFLIAVAFVLGAAVAFRVHSIHFGWGRLLVLTILVVGLTAVCLAVLTATDSFAWFTVSTFVAVGMLCGFLTYYRTVDEPKVEPAAVLRDNGPPVFGFFVAQTSDRVYLGTKVPRGAIRLDAIPREEVADMTIAALQPVDHANRLGRKLAFQICHLARERDRTEELIAKHTRDGDPKAPGREPCTSSDVKVLRPERNT